MEEPAGSQEPVCDDGVKMGVEPGVIPEGVDHHDHTQDAVIETQDCAEKHLQALICTVAKLSQQLSVVLEIDAQQYRDAEDKLPMRDWVKDIVGDVFAELNRFFRMATRAEPATFTILRASHRISGILRPLRPPRAERTRTAFRNAHHSRT